MAPTNSYGQEMVSIYLIKIKITTKFFKLMNIICFLYLFSLDYILGGAIAVVAAGISYMFLSES